MSRKPRTVKASPAMASAPSSAKQWWRTHGPYTDPAMNARDHLLRYNFEIEGWVIYPPRGFELSREDRMAIDYLVSERDYEYRAKTL